MLAQTDFETGNGELTQHYLDECQLNLRGWEHRYVSTRIRAKQTLVGHTGSVSGVAFSCDDKWIVTGSQDHSAKVWDAETGQQTLALQGHTAPVTCVAISPNGQRIVTGSDDKTAKGLGCPDGSRTLRDHGTSRPCEDLGFQPRWPANRDRRR